MFHGRPVMNSRFAALLFLFLFAGASSLRPPDDSAREDLFELSIVHLNDFHARFEETAPKNGAACYPEMEKTCVGGLPRVATMAKKLMKRPNAIFLNAGDNFQGSLWYNVHRGNGTAVIMNKLHFDALTIGNHEFDHRIAGLVPYLRMLEAPVVLANMDITEEPSLRGLTRPSVVINRGGRKIGVIGVILKTTNEIAPTERLKFLDEVETINREAEKLKDEGVDVILVLSHCGKDVEKKIAEECPDVDVVVGGHSHTFLYHGTPPTDDKWEGEYPIVVKQPANNDRTVLVVQAGAYTKLLGNLTVWFDESGEVVDWEGDPIVLDHSVEQDADMLAELEPWKEEVDAQGNRVTGSTKVYLGHKCRWGECSLGNLLTDAMVDAWIDEAENGTYWTYASIAAMNGGVVYAPLGGVHPINTANGRRELLYRDLKASQPWDNTWDVVELQGRDIIQTLEVSVSTSYSHPAFKGRQFLVWSGLRATFNVTNEPMHRLLDVKVRCRACKVPRYEDVVEDEWYRVAMPAYLVNGGDGHDVVKNNHRNRKFGKVDVDAFEEYVSRQSPLTQGLESRLTLLGDVIV